MVYIVTSSLPQEFENNEDKWRKFCALGFGVLGIGFITNWAYAIENFT